MITQSRLTQLLQKRAKKPKKFARPTLPDKAERLYLGAMRRYADVLIEVMRDQLGYRKDSPFDWRPKQAEHKIPLDEVADLTVKHGKAQAKRVLGLADQDMAPGHLIRGWKDKNVQLIQGFTSEMFSDMRGLLDANRGRRVEDFADQIEGLFGTTRARAELIARDQTLKLNSQINQEACKTAGIEWYTWSTSQDKSVRDTHAELNGKKFRFDDPPVVNKYGDTANPGEDYQCRCVPIPHVPEIDEGSEQKQAETPFDLAAGAIEGIFAERGASAIYDYINTSAPVNQYMRDLAAGTTETDAAAEVSIAALRAELSEVRAAGGVVEGVDLWRGERLMYDELSSKYQVGQVVDYSAFISSSESRSTAELFAGSGPSAIIELKGVYGTPIDAGQTREVLLEPARFQVVSRGKRGNRLHVVMVPVG